MITNQEREKKSLEISESSFEMYSSLVTAKLLGGICKKYNLQQEGEFIDLVGDLILGFYQKSDFKKLLVSNVGVSEAIASQIENDLSDFLSHISGTPSIPGASKEVRERLDLRPEGIMGNPIGETNDGSAKPLTREDVLRSLAPKRTMANDISALKQNESTTTQNNAYHIQRGGQ